jgi:transposase
VLIDESGASQKPPVRRTWARRGHPPKLRHRFNWLRLALAGALALPPGDGPARLLLSVKPGAINGARVIEFLRALRRHLRGPVIVVWDGLPAHRSALVRDWIASQHPWLSVERLPSYTPELNPVEYLWKNLQDHELANYAPEEMAALARTVRRGARRIRRKRALLRSFLKHSGLFPKLRHSVA